MEEALAVGDEILKVPELGPVHRRIIDFGDDAVPEGKPNPAGSCISSSYSILSSMRPSGLDARPSKSLHLVVFASGFHFLLLRWANPLAAIYAAQLAEPSGNLRRGRGPRVCHAAEHVKPMDLSDGTECAMKA